MSKPPQSTSLTAVEELSRGFMRIAMQFRDLQDTSPELFAAVAAEMSIGRRTAYYYAKIGRAFNKLDVDEGRLLSIGWTKLKIVADYINSSNCEQLLDLAETSTARELKILLSDGNLIDGTRCVLLYLEPSEHALFEKALFACGATKAGRGLMNKEPALARALSKSLALQD